MPTLFEKKNKTNIYLTHERTWLFELLGGKKKIFSLLLVKLLILISILYFIEWHTKTKKNLCQATCAVPLFCLESDYQLSRPHEMHKKRSWWRDGSFPRKKKNTLKYNSAAQMKFPSQILKYENIYLCLFERKKKKNDRNRLEEKNVFFFFELSLYSRQECCVYVHVSLPIDCEFFSPSSVSRP